MICGSASKAYAMTGWRIGYVAGSAELIDTATKVLESNSSCVSTISQIAAEAALDGPQDCVREMVAAYRHRRNVVVDILRDYAGYFIGDRYRDEFAQGLLALERNWQGPLVENAAVEILPVPQLVAPSVVEARPMLPSFLYLAAEHERGSFSVAY